MQIVILSFLSFVKINTEVIYLVSQNCNLSVFLWNMAWAVKCTWTTAESVHDLICRVLCFSGHF